MLINAVFKKRKKKNLQKNVINNFCCKCQDDWIKQTNKKCETIKNNDYNLKKIIAIL